MKKKILVTGGTGYIGSHTAVELIESGFEVIIVDNLSNSNIKTLDGIEKITGTRPLFEKLDVCDKSQFTSFFEKYTGIEAIIHFAAFKSVSESVANPLKYYFNNLVSTISLLDLMKKKDIQYLVFSSSCTVYGQPDELPVSENAPIKKAMSPYGNTKQIMEDIISDTLLSTPSLKAISLRYFNPIGAHPSALIGELPAGVPDNLVPFITQTAIGIRDEIKVFGDNYNTPDGSAVRDYLHVVDLAKAHVAAIQRLLKKQGKANYEIFNLGTGKGVSVLEAIESFERATGEKLNYKIVDRRAGDIEKVWGDTSYANKELGWKAEKSLDETMLSAWNWEKYLKKQKK